MRKLESKLVLMQFEMKRKAREKADALKAALTSEKGDATIIVIIIVIIIVVALAIIFRDAIAGWVNQLIGNADSVIDSAGNVGAITTTKHP